MTAHTWIFANNPFRYKGYYYDSFTEWYLIQNRYYDPCTGRFVNANLNVTANGGLFDNNLFLYCTNNPVGGMAVNNVYAPHFGAAWQYRMLEPESLSTNCLGYALNEIHSVYIDSPVPNVEIMNEKVLVTVEGRGYKIRRIAGPNAPISPNEYRIAFRVGLVPYA